MADISQIKLPDGNSYNINATTVNKHTVESDVPANAVFTDTDIKVKQSLTTSSNVDSRPVLLGYSYAATSTTDPTFATATDIVYAANEVFVRPSIGQINATSYQVAAKCEMKFNSTTQALDFIFT